MPILNYTLYLLLLVPLTNCQTTADPAPPWSGRGFTEPVSTELRLRNASDSLVRLRLSARSFPEIDPKDVPDTLQPGQSFALSFDVYRPLNLFIEGNDIPSMRPLFPGFDRSLAWTGTIFENDDPKSVYAFYDDHLEELTRPGLAPSVSDVAAFGDTLRAQYECIHGDTTDLPTWLVDLTRRDIDVAIMYEQMLIRGYYRFMLSDTLAFPPELSTRVSAVLRQPNSFQSVYYPDLWGAYARYGIEDRDMVLEGIGPNNHRALTEYLIDSFPLPARRFDAIATYLFDEIHKTKVYAGKVENIERLLNVLPEAYRSRLEQAQADFEEALASDDGDRVFLNTPLTNLAGETVTPGSARTKPFTLYKFWFEGCRPCLTQLPAEHALVAEYPDLEIVYVAFSTQKDRWPNYVDKHAPPASHHFFLPREQTEIVRQATGRVGAPTYLLVKNDEVVCRNCPKPSDALLKTYLQ